MVVDEEDAPINVTKQTDAAQACTGVRTKSWVFGKRSSCHWVS